jgi:pimeloyl-ACP methyl ester carboxylesterase
MEQITFGQVTLEYEIAGAGDPIVFIHGALIADAFRPMVRELLAQSRYRCITYHRRGYEGSTHAISPFAIDEQAADCAALLCRLQVTRAHVVGHSFGGVIALSLAMNVPELVHTVTLMEPALVLGTSGAGYRNVIAQNLARHRAGDADGTVDEFLRARFGTMYREPLERVLPGAFSQAVANAAVAFEVDMPAAADFEFRERQARRITQPALVVLGAESDALWARFGETHRLLCAWLPDVESYVLPDSAHGLQLQNPRDMAATLDVFLGKHRIDARGGSAA